MKPWIVGLVGLLLAAGFVGRVVGDADGDPTILMAFGEKDYSTREYAENRLGDVFLRPDLGHDGRFFFVQANDPWVVDPAENIEVVDRPLYRSQRMLYPVLAGGAGAFTPETIVLTMTLVNVLAVGLGTWAVSAAAIRMGGSALWGLAFVLNVGFLSEMSIGGAGVVAGAAAFAAVAAYLHRKVAWMIALLTMAVLAREAMLLASLGTAFFLWRHGEKRSAVLSVAIPSAAALVWALYLRLQIGGGLGDDQIQEIGLPLQGLIEAFGTWTQEPLDLIVGAGMVLLMILFVRRALKTDHIAGWISVGFVLLAALFTEQVWRNYFDITRAIAPVITSFALLLMLSSTSDAPSEA